MDSTTDRIEAHVRLDSPRSRLWPALAEAEAFGDWFGVDLKGQRFVAGRHARGHITHPGYEHVVWDVLIERIEPERLLSFRWHPYAVDPAVDYSGEQATLVEFTLEDVDGGTLFRVVESGFDEIPAARRDEAYRMHVGGWAQQMKNIAGYMAAH